MNVPDFREGIGFWTLGEGHPPQPHPPLAHVFLPYTQPRIELYTSVFSTSNGRQMEPRARSLGKGILPEEEEKGYLSPGRREEGRSFELLLTPFAEMEGGSPYFNGKEEKKKGRKSQFQSKMEKRERFIVPPFPFSDTSRFFLSSHTAETFPFLNCISDDFSRGKPPFSKVILVPLLLLCLH